jgi:CubicO group peptidase (beta-lactamase class C family)
MLVERVTGQRLADQLERRITSAHVRGYAPPDKDWQVSDDPARLVDVTEMDTSWGWAAGAMVSTTADLARFYQALLGLWVLTIDGATGELLSAEYHGNFDGGVEDIVPYLCSQLA